jgi:SAM-dependent methyltransferase
MEPVSTLKEAARVLRPGGIFVTYDCDWPPSVTVSLEQAYLRFMDRIKQLEMEHILSEDRVLRYHKDQHLKNIQHSGHFSFTKEIVLHHVDHVDADAFIGMAMSQGSVQTAIKEQWEEALIAKDQFVQAVKEELSDQTLSLVFSYRMRIGVK